MQPFACWVFEIVNDERSEPPASKWLVRGPSNRQTLAQVVGSQVG